jgi:hypothetical protein
MIGKDDVRRVREQMGSLEPPVLSVYADVHPGKPYNAKRAWLIRVKNSIKDLGLPAALEKSVYEAIEQRMAPEARTLALFAGPRHGGEVREARLEVIRLPLHVDLPVVDVAHGRVEARWGEVYVAPLLYALDEYERAGIVWLRGNGWRFFELFLGEIEERTQVFAGLAPELWKRLAEYDPRRVRELASARTGGLRDRFSSRMETAVYRYLKQLADLTERAVAMFEIKRLVLLGPPDQTSMFFQMLSLALRQAVVSHIAKVPPAEAHPAEVMQIVEPVLHQMEREEELRRLDQIREQPGVWGLGPTLEALQAGRLSVIAAPWDLNAKVWISPQGLMGVTREAAQAISGGQDVREIPLRDAILETCQAYATRLEFVSGPAGERLMREMGGLAGLLRW